MTAEAAKAFRELCTEQGLAVTHQRQIIYEVMCSMHGHPSPEDVFQRVRELIPAISLATVYKNIHVFLASGIFREVSPHHGSLRIEVNPDPHHHMVCTQCRSIQDVSEAELEQFRPASASVGGGHRPLPNGFVARRLAVDVLGL